MLEWPRNAFIPPPATPMLPSRSCNHRHGADVLSADRVLRPAKSEQGRQRLVGDARRWWRTGRRPAGIYPAPARCYPTDARHHLGRIPIDMLTQQVDHAAQVLPRVVDLCIALLIEFVVPARSVCTHGRRLCGAASNSPHSKPKPSFTIRLALVYARTHARAGLPILLQGDSGSRCSGTQCRSRGGSAHRRRRRRRCG